VLDRTEIVNLLATYNVNGDRGRLSELAAAFAPNGVLIGRERWSGRAGIAEGLARRQAGRSAQTEGGDRQMAFVRHHLTTSLITFDNEKSARGRSYFLAVTNVGLDHSGVYVDWFIKLDDRWFIAEREVRIDWVAPDGHTHLTRGRGATSALLPAAPSA
jgi:hypothetical protein